jgi:hypothetical protein
LRFIEQLLRTMANEETGFRPGFDQASIFQFEIGLDRRGHADAMLPASSADGRNSVAGPQDAAFNQLTDVRSDTRVKRFASGPGDSRNNHGTMMSHRTRSRQTVPA